MTARPLPRVLRKALDAMETDPARDWTVGEIASAAGAGRRSLQRQFQRFLGRMPMAFLRDLRLDRARQELLRAPDCASVSSIAAACGFNHLGRFAARYRERYGETPSATLSRRQYVPSIGTQRLTPPPPSVERPRVSVLPFTSNGATTSPADGVADEITAALMRLRWVRMTLPERARYHIRGKIRGNGAGRLRLSVFLIDAADGRYLWADRFDGDSGDFSGFEERAALGIATAIEPTLREAEIDRARREDPERLNAWELTMRALPYVSSVEAAAEEVALELLERAIDLAPSDALPIALAAWCHGLRGCHNFCPRPEAEKAAARDLSWRAAQLNAGDPLTETLLAAGYTLAHELGTAAIHAERALALDGGSSWAWGRSAWIKAYGGEMGEAIERFQIARSLAPCDRMGFLWCVGIAAAHFGNGCYPESARWFETALLENPVAVWINYAMAPAYALAGRSEDARRSMAALARAFPDLTIRRVTSGLPYRSHHLERMAEGLESAGMRRA